MEGSVIAIVLYGMLCVTGLLVILCVIKAIQFTFAKPGQIFSSGGLRFYTTSLMICMSLTVVLNIVRFL